MYNISIVHTVLVRIGTQQTETKYKYLFINMQIQMYVTVAMNYIVWVTSLQGCRLTRLTMNELYTVKHYIFAAS